MTALAAVPDPEPRSELEELVGDSLPLAAELTALRLEHLLAGIEQPMTPDYQTRLDASIEQRTRKLVRRIHGLPIVADPDTAAEAELELHLCPTCWRKL